MLAELREKLANSPKALTIGLIVLVVVGSLWFGWTGSGAEKYPQDPVLLRCTACSYQLTTSIDDYAARLQKDKPNGRELMEGPQVTCPKCKKMTFVTVQEDSNQNQAAPTASPPRSR